MFFRLFKRHILALEVMHLKPLNIYCKKNLGNKRITRPRYLCEADLHLRSSLTGTNSVNYL